MVKRVGASGGMMTPRGSNHPRPAAPMLPSTNSGGMPGALIVSTPRRGSLLGSFTSRLGGMLGRGGSSRKEAAAHQPSILGGKF